jgi:hypothetical protein
MIWQLVHNQGEYYMKSFNLDLKQLISTAVHSGAITVDDINAAIAEPRGLNMPCGVLRNGDWGFAAVFFSTDKESGAVNRSKDGVRVKFNIRAQQAKKQNAAQTPGQVLPQTAGAPVLTPEMVAGLAALGIQLPTAPAPVVATAVADDETDFSKISL